MYFFLILFFGSLGAIILMIGRKLLLINNLEIHSSDYDNRAFISNIFDSHKIKNSAIKISKRTGHTLIWIILRTYLVSMNFITKKGKEIGEKIKNRLNKNHDKLKENKEVSRYIKIISEYRQKIKKMKYKIKEEEGIE
jgi:hypothetical protein